jgi:hypothetical protein
MPQTYILKKTLNVDTKYEAESDKLYVIRKAGTNSSTASAVLSVAGGVCLELINLLSPLNPTYLNKFEPVDLGEKFVVIPPKKKFSFTGDSGSKLLVEGQILELAPGEPIPDDLIRRYERQTVEYLKYLKAVYSHGTDAAWAADLEKEVLSFSCPAGERHTFRNIMYANIANLSAAPAAGDWTLRFYHQDKPLDILDPIMGDLGIDMWNWVFHDGTNYNYRPFSIEKMPITLEPGRSLKIKARNVSGASKSPATGTSITITVAILDELTLLP